MDRFIAYEMFMNEQKFRFKIQYGQIYSQSVHLYSIFIANLKSNMDRFIEELLNHSKSQSQYLKSNMDRFIVTYHLFSVQQYRNLKSNMDRFIG